MSKPMWGSGQITRRGAVSLVEKYSMRFVQYEMIEL